MRSINRIGTLPASLPLLADNILEFHAARLLLLMNICGTANRIDGLTKMAKLDFFTRYPDFFDVARAATTSKDTTSEIAEDRGIDTVESAMVRHHYGPWDKRYYHVLAHLESKGLISVSKVKSTYRISLTELGAERAKRLAERPSFGPLVAHMKNVKSVFGKKSGTALKDLIYRVFDKEVGKQTMGKAIVK
jgi:DNA-binding PadR family transcriptional regulator